MPRATININEPFAFEVANVAYLKKNVQDVLYDYKIMFNIQLNRFKDFLNDYDHYTIFKDLEFLKSQNVQPIHKNRVYIVTNLDYVPFMLVDMDEPVVDNLIGRFHVNSPHWLTPDFISTLFIFKNENLVYSSDLTPNDVAKLTAVFKKENITEFNGHRYDLYAKPRRKNKTT